MPHMWNPVTTVLLSRSQTQDTTIEVASTQSKEAIPLRWQLQETRKNCYLIPWGMPPVRWRG